LVGTLYLNEFGLAEDGRVFNQSGGRFAEHHSTWRGNRFHALSHSHLLADRRIPHWAGTDFARDHLTRVEAYPQPELDSVASLHLERNSLCRLLNLKCREAGAKGMVLQCDRCAEHRHDAVAGELVDGSAVALDHSRRTVE